MVQRCNSAEVEECNAILAHKNKGGEVEGAMVQRCRGEMEPHLPLVLEPEELLQVQLHPLHVYPHELRRHLEHTLLGAKERNIQTTRFVLASEERETRE